MTISVCNTHEVAPNTFRDLIPVDVDLDARIVVVLETLERNGWYPRTLVNDDGIRYWPDNERPRQIVVTYTSALIGPRLAFFVKHTGIQELLGTTEEKVNK